MIRILLVDDHVVLRSAYRRLIEAAPGLAVVAEAGGVDLAYEQVVGGGIDVVILDLDMSGGSAFELMRRILARYPAPRVVVCSIHDHPSFAAQAMRAGAAAYLGKSCEPGEIVAAIRDVVAGRRVVSPATADALARQADDATALLGRLTPREFDVLRLAARGLSTGGIADCLHRSDKTVRNHLAAVRHKLGVSSDFELFRIAVENRIAEI